MVVASPVEPVGMCAYLKWSMIGLPAAVLLLVMSPPLLPILAVLLLLGPAPRRAEQLGLTQSIASVLVLVGMVSLFGGGATPFPWLTAGVGVAALGVVRYRWELHGGPLSSARIEQRWPPGSHEVATAVALSAVAATFMVTNLSSSVSRIYDGVPRVVLALSAIAITALPLVVNRTRVRIAMRALCALLLAALSLLPSLALSFYFLPSALMLAAAALDADLERPA